MDTDLSETDFYRREQSKRREEDGHKKPQEEQKQTGKINHIPVFRGNAEAVTIQPGFNAKTQRFAAPKAFGVALLHVPRASALRLIVDLVAALPHFAFELGTSQCGPNAPRQFSQNNLPLWRPNPALSLGGQISPPAKTNRQCDKAQEYERKTQTMSGSAVLRRGAWNWIVFPSGTAMRVGGFGPHRACENFAGQYASLSRSNQFRPRPAPRRLRLLRSQISMALAGRAVGVSSISAGPVNLTIGLLSIYDSPVPPASPTT